MFKHYADELENLSVLDLVGVGGFILYVLGYLLLTLRILSGRSPAYYVVNLAAASMVLAALAQSFNLASAMIQVTWILISLLGLLRTTVWIASDALRKRAAHGRELLSIDQSSANAPVRYHWKSGSPLHEAQPGHQSGNTK